MSHVPCMIKSHQGCVMGIPKDSVELAFFEVPHCNYTGSAPSSHQGESPTCGCVERGSGIRVQQ